MKFKSSLLVTVIGGIIVIIVALFVIEPIRDFIFNNNRSAENQQIADKNKELNHDTISDLQKNNLNAKNENIYHLQPYRPLELLNGRLIITFNQYVNYQNEGLSLKITDKKTGDEVKFEEKELGDVVYYDEYVITFFALDKNISTYDLKIIFEDILEYKAARISGYEID